MSVGSLEEIIDDNHAIVSTSVGSEHYVSILSFVDKDQLEPGNLLYPQTRELELNRFFVIFYQIFNKLFSLVSFIRQIRLTKLPDL